MATYRETLKKYVGRWVPGVTATLVERSGGRTGYGYLLEDVRLPDGESIDHCWFGGVEGMGCIRWPDGTTCLGQRLRFTAYFDEYLSEGSLRHGGDGVGIGIADIKNEEVQMDGAWLAISEAAKKIRREKRLGLLEDKNDPNYIWPGRWTYSADGLRVKAAKSAIPGALCQVSSKDGMHDEMVILGTFDPASGTWLWEHTAERKAEIAAQEEQERKRKQKRKEEKAEAKLKADKQKTLKRFMSLSSERGRQAMLTREPWILDENPGILEEARKAATARKKKVAKLKASGIVSGTWTMRNGMPYVKAAKRLHPGTEIRILPKHGIDEGTAVLVRWDAKAKAWEWEKSRVQKDREETARKKEELSNFLRTEFLKRVSGESVEKLVNYLQSDEVARAAMSSSNPLLVEAAALHDHWQRRKTGCVDHISINRDRARCALIDVAKRVWWPQRLLALLDEFERSHWNLGNREALKQEWLRIS